jgi:hypothetical protein
MMGWHGSQIMMLLQPARVFRGIEHEHVGPLSRLTSTSGGDAGEVVCVSVCVSGVYVCVSPVFSLMELYDLPEGGHSRVKDSPVTGSRIIAFFLFLSSS